MRPHARNCDTCPSILACRGLCYNTDSSTPPWATPRGGDVEMEVGKGAGGDGGSIGRCGERTDRQTDRDMKE